MGIMVYSLLWVMQDLYYQISRITHKPDLASGQDGKGRDTFRTASQTGFVEIRTGMQEHVPCATTES